MAEAFLNEICGDEFEAQSAGLEPGTLNPLAIQVMKEIGIDISQKATRAVFAVWKSGQIFTYVVTVCGEAEADARACPIFPGPATRLYWPFDDPSSLKGSDAAKLEKTRHVRDAIKAKIEEWCRSICAKNVTS